jgi:hypothetical protein
MHLKKQHGFNFPFNQLSIKIIGTFLQNLATQQKVDDSWAEEFMSEVDRVFERHTVVAK